MAKYNPWVRPNPDDHKSFVRSLTKAERAEVIVMMRAARVTEPEIEIMTAKPSRPVTKRAWAKVMRDYRNVELQRIRKDKRL